MKHIKIIFFSCMFTSLSSHSAIAMRRTLEESINNQTPSRLCEYPQESTTEQNIFQELHAELKDGILKQASLMSKVLQVPKTTLRLVSKKAYEFCDKDKIWSFNKNNYLSFKEEIESLWIEPLLKKLPSLSFHNDIDSSALESDLNLEEWEKEYIFISREDLDCIMTKACELKNLSYYNIPFLGTFSDIKISFSCAKSIKLFNFYYETSIFDASIPLTEIWQCKYFVNLKRIILNSGVFFSIKKEDEEYQDSINKFFLNLTNLESLTLRCVEEDNETDEFSTALFKPLTCLKKLNNLEIDFVNNPELLPLTCLSSLNLKTLSIKFEATTDDINENNDKYSGMLPLLLKHLTRLENISFNNDLLEAYETSDVILNNKVVREKYPQLKKVSGNDVLSFDSK